MALLLKNVLFTVIVPGTVAVYLPLLIARGSPAASGVRLAFAIALMAVGGFIYAWCVWDFAAFGRATPAPIDAPKRLVVRGLYRHVRNPMYLGVLAVILGSAILFRSPAVLAYAVAAGICFHLFIVFYEEPRRRREFGSEYDAYRAVVRRWLPGRRQGSS